MGPGRLGNGSTSDSNVPVQVSNLTSVVAIAAGNLALKSDGTVWAWGNVPVQVRNLTGVVAIAGGFQYSLAVKSDGTAWAWGNNAWGQLGDGSKKSSKVPVKVKNLTGVVAVAAAGGGGGRGVHSMALKNDGTVWAWGSNGSGRLGNGSFTNSLTPVRASNLTGAVDISAGGEHSMALMKDGTIRAWGRNPGGQVSYGRRSLHNKTPVKVSYIDGPVADISGGGQDSLITLANGFEASHSIAALSISASRPWQGIIPRLKSSRLPTAAQRLCGSMTSRPSD